MPWVFLDTGCNLVLEPCRPALVQPNVIPSRMSPSCPSTSGQSHAQSTSGQSLSKLEPLLALAAKDKSILIW
jgi:hypothetical protein